MKMNLQAELIFIWKVPHLETRFETAAQENSEMAYSIYCHSIAASIGLGQGALFLSLRETLWELQPDTNMYRKVVL